MIKLNDYLYSGDTVLKILHRYAYDLKQDSVRNGDSVSMAHSDFLSSIIELLEHNEFLTQQSQRIREFYIYMAKKYPHLAFTFKGRIKSLIRAEEKFNGYIVEYITEYYMENGRFPSPEEIANRLTIFRDLIAYRIVISIPKCHLEPGETAEDAERAYLYEIANELPAFLEERGFTAIGSGHDSSKVSPLLDEKVRGLYRDYVVSTGPFGYQSLHITFYDMSAHCHVELQLRTKDMDDVAEIGAANHYSYERSQGKDRGNRGNIPEGKNRDFDEALIRFNALHELDLSAVDVNMFGAVNNHLINDGCGLYRGRLILPYEHLSRFQNDR